MRNDQFKKFTPDVALSGANFCQLFIKTYFEKIYDTVFTTIQLLVICEQYHAVFNY